MILKSGVTQKIVRKKITGIYQSTSKLAIEYKTKQSRQTKNSTGIDGVFDVGNHVRDLSVSSASVRKAVEPARKSGRSIQAQIT